MGIAFAKLGEYQDALNCFEHALKLNPSFSEAWYDNRVISVLIGNSVVANKYFKEAANLKQINQPIAIGLEDLLNY